MLWASLYRLHNLDLIDWGEERTEKPYPWLVCVLLSLQFRSVDGVACTITNLLDISLGE